MCSLDTKPGPRRHCCLSLWLRSSWWRWRVRPRSISRLPTQLFESSWKGSLTSGSNEHKSYMLAQLKSSIVHFGCPIIYLTINPHEWYSPIALFYAGEDIDVHKFQPKWYSLSQWLKRMLNNPLAVVEYFHNMITAIIENVLKDGIFGDVNHYYATIEYQGRGTPHMHLAVSIICNAFNLINLYTALD